MEIVATLVTSLVSGSIAGYLAFLLKAIELQKTFRLQDNAERVVGQLLNDEQWRLRSFVVIRHHLGGFEDDELRKLLVRAGAIRFKSKSGFELWGLLERNRDRLGYARINEDPNRVVEMQANGDLFGATNA